VQKNSLKIFFYFTLLIFLFSCSSKTEKVLKPETIPPLEILYKQAYQNFEIGKYQNAMELFSSIERNYNYTEWASKAILFKSYIYYDSSRYIEALENLKNYKKIYPANPEIAYVDYMIAMCLFEQINLSSKDQESTKLARDQIIKVLKRYPNTEYASDLKLKLDLINDQLAGKEMYVARYYQKREKWLSALKRLFNIINNYETTIYTEEALHRIVEIYYRLGDIESAKKYVSILGYNFNDSDWYKKSYKIIVDQKFIIDKKKQKKTFKDKLKTLIN
jgi:outer membrane protein assembly factor BamD